MAYIGGIRPLRCPTCRVRNVTVEVFNDKGVSCGQYCRRCAKPVLKAWQEYENETERIDRKGRTETHQ